MMLKRRLGYSATVVMVLGYATARRPTSTRTPTAGGQMIAKWLKSSMNPPLLDSLPRPSSASLGFVGLRARTHL